MTATRYRIDDHGRHNLPQAFGLGDHVVVKVWRGGGPGKVVGTLAGFVVGTGPELDVDVRPDPDAFEVLEACEDGLGAEVLTYGDGVLRNVQLEDTTLVHPFTPKDA